MLVIIPCGGKKQTVPCQARDMYTGPYFKACLRHALSLTNEKNILILSAKYGLLNLDEVIEPYDLRMGQPGCVSYLDVRLAATRLGVLHGDYYVLALGGKRYTDICEEVWPHCCTPLKGVGGIGKQMKWLKEHTT